MAQEITREMIEALAHLRAFSTAVKAERNALEIDKGAALAIDLLDNADFFTAIDDVDFELYQCGDTSAGLTEPPCDLDKPCPVHDGSSGPAERGDITGADRARHQGDDPERLVDPHTWLRRTYR
jgi:hypothetical protein